MEKDRFSMLFFFNESCGLCTLQIPNLVSLKRRSSVLFVGIDSLDDIKNNSYNEIFVSGGCIISDELIFDPDVVSEGKFDQSNQLQLCQVKRHNCLFLKSE